MQVELMHDEPDFFRLTRMGNWIHMLDYATNEGQWMWVPIAEYSQAIRKQIAAMEFIKLTNDSQTPVEENVTQSTEFRQFT